ncbi:ATP-binding protein [Streptomyces uncialis]|uniref:ATP-binding protein n=1 Tax=Streptomyces uncialis TaxID=1048205 RepID=UPI0033E8DD4B
MDPTDREPEPYGQDAPGPRETRDRSGGGRPDPADPAAEHRQPTDGTTSEERDRPYAADEIPGPHPGPAGPAAPDTRDNPYLPALRENRDRLVPALPDPGAPPRPRAPRDPLTSDFTGAPTTPRTVRLSCGELLLTVNPVDGSEIERRPPGDHPAPPERHAPQTREEIRRAATPPVPPGPALARPPLLERQEERERAVRLIARGRSVRLTGPAGCGRTALLDAVADDCADLAPDGVIRLTGFRRTVTDLLHDLYAAVFSGPGQHPDRQGVLDQVRGIGAVVVVDDLAFGGAALDELLDATPECAFVLAADPDVTPPGTDAPVEEVFLGGLSRAGGVALLAHATGRPLSENEANWAGDLWFESEGLPLRFVQAAALLRQRDALRADPDAFTYADPDTGPDGSSHDRTGDRTGDDHHDGDGDEPDVPLPSLAEGAAPAALLASRLSGAARATLRFAVALEGEVPHQAHLPALVGDTHADAALAELVGVALVTPVGPRYRLATGVRTQLEGAGYADDAPERLLTAARHYAWWAGHPSVTPARVAAEADAVIAVLAAPLNAAENGSTDADSLSALLDPAGEPDGPSASVGLARAAAPALAAGADWNAWEQVLRLGVAAARHTGEVADEAYFHHELGVLALCEGRNGRARAELEASIGLRGAVADKRGAVAGRRALALVDDRSVAGAATAGEAMSGARREESVSPPGGLTRVFALPPGTGASGAPDAPDPADTLVSGREPADGFASRLRGARRTVLSGTRRNLVAAGAGGLLAALLGTVVTLGVISDTDDPPAGRVGTEPSASQDADDTAGVDEAGPEGGQREGTGGADTGSTSRPGGPGSTGGPSASTDAVPGAGAGGESSPVPGAGGPVGDPGSGTGGSGGSGGSGSPGGAGDPGGTGEPGGPGAPGGPGGPGEPSSGPPSSGRPPTSERPTTPPPSPTGRPTAPSPSASSPGGGTSPPAPTPTASVSPSGSDAAAGPGGTGPSGGARPGESVL